MTTTERGRRAEAAVLHLHGLRTRGRGDVGDVDLFAAWEPGTTALYLVPVDAVPSGYAYLRVQPAANGQAQGVRWARDFVVPT